MKKEVHIFTDGACRNNPGPGGWGALLQFQDKEREVSGAESCTTNNRMELMAAIKALSILRESCSVVLTTDSQYLRQGITTWISGWKKKGWKTSAGKPVKNQDLWEQLDKEVQRHEVRWKWVRAHQGHAENERVDVLARMAIDQLKDGSSCVK